jgi:hypothetical protein
MAGAAIALLAAGRPAAQPPSFEDVLKRAASYVARFHEQLSEIVAEETYWQNVVNTSRFTNTMLLQPARTLRSDLILVRSDEAQKFVELRDVFEVDGTPVRDRQARLEKLLTASSSSSGSQIAAILKESARYNIGSIQGTSTRRCWH